jgi:sugar phosphate isomerase/epimerase
MRLLSLAALTILDAGPIGQVQAAADAGWPSVGLRLQPFVESDEAIVGRRARERELRRSISATRMKVLEVGVFPVRQDFRLERVLAVLDFSAELGAAFAIAPVEDPDIGRRAENFATLSQAAADRGLRALIEFNPYSACRTLSDGIAMLDLAEDPRAALCLDALHFFRSGASPRELAEIDPAKLALLHFCDAGLAPAADLSEADLRRESRTARRLPGEGVLPLRELLAVLPPDIPLSVEAPSLRLAGMPADERAKIALETTRLWLAGALVA